MPTEDWWFTAGQPLVLIEHHEGELTSLPRFSRHVTALPEAGLHLSHCMVENKARLLGVWFLQTSHRTNLDALRRLRIHLFRLHAEHECLKQVLRLILQRKIEIEPRTPSSDRLQEYLRDAARLLSRENAYGHKQFGLEAAREFGDVVSPGERDTLLSQLSRIRRNILLNLTKLTESRERFSRPVHVVGTGHTIIVGTVQQMGGQTVKKYEIKFGDNTIFHGDLVVAETIQNSFNKIAGSDAKQEIKDGLQQLSQAVAEVTQHLSQEKARQASRDLESLTNEATSESPRRPWYELSAKGLLEAATTLGAIGEPVIGCVKKLLALLTPQALGQDAG